MNAKAFQDYYPDYVSGGMIASLVDCHCTGTASATAYKTDRRSMVAPGFPGL